MAGKSSRDVRLKARSLWLSGKIPSEICLELAIAAPEQFDAWRADDDWDGLRALIDRRVEARLSDRRSAIRRRQDALAIALEAAAARFLRSRSADALKASELKALSSMLQVTTEVRKMTKGASEPSV